jgi:hypothetical protein
LWQWLISNANLSILLLFKIFLWIFIACRINPSYLAQHRSGSIHWLYLAVACFMYSIMQGGLEYPPCISLPYKPTSNFTLSSLLSTGEGSPMASYHFFYLLYHSLYHFALRISSFSGDTRYSAKLQVFRDYVISIFVTLVLSVWLDFSRCWMREKFLHIWFHLETGEVELPEVYLPGCWVAPGKEPQCISTDDLIPQKVLLARGQEFNLVVITWSHLWLSANVCCPEEKVILTKRSLFQHTL